MVVLFISAKRLANMLTLFLILVLFSGRLMADQPLTPEQEEYFEARVRPLLFERCVDCHGPDDQSGLLRLDRKPSIDRRVGSGPIVVPGRPDESLLVRAIRFEDSALQMPPEGKLSQEEIDTLEQWVADGGYWPGADSETGDDMDLSPSEQIDQIRESHWAYRPIANVAPPAVGNDQWPQQAIDYFILSKLEQAGLHPNPQADRAVLINRAYFTLTGLPPTYEEVVAFVQDDSPGAFASLIDRLLESPHYGERWARHWLDLARFAETTGYFPGNMDTTYPYAFTYRDYVINAFNDDKPFDQFVLEQIAADHLDLAEENREALAAMGFLTVGRKFMNRVHDIIDDRIDVVTRGFLGLSVTCARCHDHKYDPIPIDDYYSLYGVFASSHEPAELPLIGDPEQSPLYEEFLTARAEKQKEVDEWLEQKRLATEDELRSRVADYLVYLVQTSPHWKVADVQQKGRRGVLRPPAIQRWQKYLENADVQAHPVWSVWHQLMALPPDEFEQLAFNFLQAAISQDQESNKVESPEIVLENSVAPMDLELIRRLADQPLASMTDAAEAIGGYVEEIYARWKNLSEEDPSLGHLGDESAERVRQLLYNDQAPMTLDTGQILGHLNQAERGDYNRQLSKVKAVESKHPGAPGRAMVLEDRNKPHDPVVFLRGQPGNRGDSVPRRFLQILSHVDGGQPFQNGSGRLELAQAIASPNNPLTARVIVNRVWQAHFGFGLVRTASDFGSRGEPPTHPELLDYLAAEFMQDGWSIKRLQRRIMLSATWQQSSAERHEAHRVDPENRLLWHYPRRRLEFEPLRDRILAVSGRLDRQVGGRSAMIHQDATRRALYAYIDREDVPSLLASFDVPSPDASQATRSRTTVPQQALYLLNSPFVIQQAEALAAQVNPLAPVTPVADSLKAEGEREGHPDKPTTDRQRVVQLYRLALARDPDEQEIALALAFVTGRELPLENSAQSGEGDWQQEPHSPWKFGYGHHDLQNNTVHFALFPVFANQRWQASNDFPDARLGHAMLAAGGGHPGDQPHQATILRWVAPGSGKVSISGLLKHSHDQGDGVRAMVVSSRHGILKSWNVMNDQVTSRVSHVEVEQGDYLDFIVDCNENAAYDSYQWSPRIRASRLAEGELIPGTVWDATNDFSLASRQQLPSKPVNPWVQLSQAILASNEFAFVD